MLNRKREPPKRYLDSVNSKLEKLSKLKSFTELDYSITSSKILKCIKALKPGKTSGLDSILNEVIKAIAYEIFPTLQKLFNLIYNSGYYPLNWRKAITIRIFKKDKDFNDPSSYRGIALISCLAKLFNNILNERLVSFLNKHSVISEFQIGFKKGSRTPDHVFILRHLIDPHVKQRKKDIFAAFIDFEKAFDTI